MLRHVLIGVFIGLKIMLVLIYYPDFLDRFRTPPLKTEDVTEKAGKILSKSTDRLKPFLEETFKTLNASNDETGSGNVIKSRKDEDSTGLAAMTDMKAVEHVLEAPVFLSFDNRRVAEEFVTSIKRSTDIDLGLVNKSYRYVVFIPAENEEERIKKEVLIREKTGVRGKHNQ